MRTPAASRAWGWGFCALTVLLTAAGVMTFSPQVVMAAPASANGPTATPDRPDFEARDLFRSGRYAEALVIYQRLYTETHHPTYLRNIGRCHQMMREAKPAIESFRAYLSDANNLDRAERAEIDGYIAEMQRLEVAASEAPGRSSAITATSSSAPSASGSDAITRKWWFWTSIGAVAIAGVIAVVAARGGNDRLPCPGGAVCPP